MTNSVLFLFLSGVVNTISKLNKTCVLRLTPDNLYFILSGKVSNGGVSMWCELLQVGILFLYIFWVDYILGMLCNIFNVLTCTGNTELFKSVGSTHGFFWQVNFFDEYQIEGVSPDANEICLEVAPENISRALKTAQNAKSVKIKLTKKHCPCLTLAAELVSFSLFFH